MRYFLILVLLVLFVSTMGCGGVANESTTGNNSSQDSQTTNTSSTCSTTQPSLVEVTSDIDSNTTWKTDTVYLIKTYDFYVNATLTIEPGTIIKFHPTLGPVMMLGSGGVIKAQGTEDEPIIFTSYYEDDNDFWIETGASLTLEENVTLKFSADSVMVLADGTSQLVLSSGSNEEEQALFTSYKDDNSKSDTNADGTNSSPSSTDWLGIYDDTAIAPYYINWSNINYAANP